MQKHLFIGIDFSKNKFDVTILNSIEQTFKSKLRLKHFFIPLEVICRKDVINIFRRYCKRIKKLIYGHSLFLFLFHKLKLFRTCKKKYFTFFNIFQRTFQTTFTNGWTVCFGFKNPQRKNIIQRFLRLDIS